MRLHIVSAYGLCVVTRPVASVLRVLLASGRRLLLCIFFFPHRSIFLRYMSVCSVSSRPPRPKRVMRVFPPVRRGSLTGRPGASFCVILSPKLFSHPPHRVCRRPVFFVSRPQACPCCPLSCFPLPLPHCHLRCNLHAAHKHSVLTTPLPDVFRVFFVFPPQACPCCPPRLLLPAASGFCLRVYICLADGVDIPRCVCLSVCLSVFCR